MSQSRLNNLAIIIIERERERFSRCVGLREEFLDLQLLIGPEDKLFKPKYVILV